MKRMLKSKAAQITVFIIIGIILLFSSAIIIYIKNKVTQTVPTPTIIKNVPEDLDGLNKYIEDCVYKTGKEGVILASAHGGYIDGAKTNLRSNSINPTENANALEVFPNSGYIIPYWGYLDSRNNCGDGGSCMFNSKKPQLRSEGFADSPDSIQAQIESYVENNLRNCLNDFKTYKSMGYEINELSNIDAKATITNSEVVVDVSWQIDAGVDKMKKLDRFFVRLPVNLERLYNFAESLVKLQYNISFLETNTLNLIVYGQKDYSVSDKGGKDRLPPMADYSFLQKGPQTWSLKESQKHMENILSLWINKLRVKNTLNGVRYFYSEPMIQAIMDKMILNTYDDTLYPLNVNFKYSTFWPIYFDVNPRDGDHIMSEVIGLPILSLIGIGINQNEFQYDVSYPVMVEISDQQAFNGEGVSFVFALEANVRNNRPLTADFQSIAVQSAKHSFACDLSQRRSGNITVNTYDAWTGDALDDVLVTFAFSSEGCLIGNTNLAENVSSLTGNYPKGIGRLLVKKHDYLSNQIIYAVGDGKEDEINFSLYQIVEREVSVKKYDVVKNSVIGNCGNGKWTFLSNVTNVSKDESVNILIEYVAPSGYNDILIDALVYNGSKPNENHKIRLAPGKYKLTIISTLNKNLTLPQQTECYGEGSCVTYDEISQSPYQEGMMMFDNNTYYFEVSPKDLYESEKIEFYAVTYDLGSVQESCRKQSTDLSPSPSMDEILRLKKALVYPKLYKINETSKLQ